MFTNTGATWSALWISGVISVSYGPSFGKRVGVFKFSLKEPNTVSVNQPRASGKIALGVGKA